MIENLSTRRTFNYFLQFFISATPLNFLQENANLLGFVVPAKAGTQLIKTLDPRFRGDDE